MNPNHRHDHDDEPVPGYEDNPVALSPDRNIRISMGLLWTCAISLVTGTVTIAFAVWNFSAQQQETKRDIAEMKRLIKASWTVADEREYTHRLQRDNPALKLPSPAEVWREVHAEN